jgi:hypothetical protein
VSGRRKSSGWAILVESLFWTAGLLLSIHGAINHLRAGEDWWAAFYIWGAVMCYFCYTKTGER